jgi:uncharacterized membrane protein
MIWIALVLLGASANAVVNLGYKMIAGKVDVVLAASGALFISAITLFIYSVWWRGIKPAGMLQTDIMVKILCIGLGAALVTVFFTTALAKGPISIVDPLWACIYALTSVIIGMILLAEAPSVWALTGIGLYIAGAILMTRG